MFFGFGITAINPILCPGAGEPFVAPTINSWQAIVADTAPFANVVMSGSTLGPNCRVKWLIKNGTKKIYYTAFSSPEQSAPHTDTFNVSVVADRGLWYDLYWRWIVGAVSSPADILIAPAAVYIPTYGEGGGTYHS